MIHLKQGSGTMHIIFQALYKVSHESVKGTNMSMDGHQQHPHRGSLLLSICRQAILAQIYSLYLHARHLEREREKERENYTKLQPTHFLTHTHISLISLCHLEGHCGQFISREGQTKSKDDILD